MRQVLFKITILCCLFTYQHLIGQGTKGLTFIPTGFHSDSIQKRIALVIGNAKYDVVGQQLSNPVHDADSMAAVLNDLGFKVIEKINMKKEEMTRVLHEFNKVLPEYNVALFYYSGHGIQVKGENYLIPIDAKLEDEDYADDECIEVQKKIVDPFNQYNDHTNIIILDACRSNPFRSFKRDVLNAGFKAMDNPPLGTIIAFATSRESSASDGKGINGLYTQELIKQMRVPNQQIEFVFKNTRAQVAKLSSYAQLPEEWNQLIGDFYFINNPMLNNNHASYVLPLPNNTLPFPLNSKPDNASLPKPVQSLIDNMVLIGGGTFTMGCTDEQGNACDKNEKPAYPVTVSDFKIERYLVTQAQWMAVMETDNNPSWFRGCDSCPVERVSWNDVQRFIDKLYKMTGKRFRLPTEAEWEYAARGGNKNDDKSKFSGSNSIGSVAWYSDNAGAKTHPVGQKKPNELGLYDMSGNVWEFCADWYSEDFYKKGFSKNPRGPNNGESRVIRGGAWNAQAKYCRVATRSQAVPDNGNNYMVGFRLALDSW